MTKLNWERDKEKEKIRSHAPERAPKVITFKARFNGTCKSCSKVIRVGQRISWTRTFGAYHVKCGRSQMNSS